MELRQLRYLVTLARELSFTNAAEKANVAQPALSRQIRKLEDELGVALVDRTSRRVRLTAEGHQLVQRAARILDEVDEARAELGQVTELIAGRLAIGTTQTPGPLNLLRLLAEFHATHPAIALSVREELSVHVAARLRADEIDLGFVSEIQERDREGLDLRRVASEPLVLALPPAHRLAGQDEVEFGDLRDEQFVLFPERATIRETFDELARRHGVSPRVSFVTTDTDRMRELVSLGLGISLLPESDAIRAGSVTATTHIRGQRLTYSVFLARRSRRRPSPAAAAMSALVDASYAIDPD